MHVLVFKSFVFRFCWRSHPNARIKRSSISFLAVPWRKFEGKNPKYSSYLSWCSMDGEQQRGRAESYFVDPVLGMSHCNASLCLKLFLGNNIKFWWDTCEWLDQVPWYYTWCCFSKDEQIFRVRFVTISVNSTRPESVGSRGVVLLK